MSHAIRRATHIHSQAHSEQYTTHTIHKTESCVYRESLTLYVAQRTYIARLILNSIRLTQYTRHAATAPTQRNDVNH